MISQRELIARFMGLTVLTFFLSSMLSAQNKPSLTGDAFSLWPRISINPPYIGCSPISFDGNFIAFVIRKGADGTGGVTGFVITSKGDTILKKDGFTPGLFYSGNQNFVMFSSSDKDSVILYNLTKKTIHYFTGVKEIKLSNSIIGNGPVDYLILWRKDNALEFYNPLKNEKKSVENVLEFRMVNRGRMTLVNIFQQEHGNKLALINLSSLKTCFIERITEGRFQIGDVQCAISSNIYVQLFSQDDIKTNTIYKIEDNGKMCRKLLSNETIAKWNSAFEIKNGFFVSNSENSLILNLVDFRPGIKQAFKDSNLSVWSYLDFKVGPLTEDLLKRSKVRMALYFLESGNVEMVRTDKAVEEVYFGIEPGKQKWLFAKRYFDTLDLKRSDYYAYSGFSLEAISILNGERRSFEFPDSTSYYEISPIGKYIFFLRRLGYKVSEFYISDLTTGKIRCYKLPNVIGGEDIPFEVLGWAIDDERMFLKDGFDIWMIDPRMMSDPVNLTNGLGVRKKIQFEFGTSSKIIDINTDQILIGLDDKTKKNGFFKLAKNADPIELSCEDALFYSPLANDALSIIDGDNAYFKPIKAERADIYLTSRSIRNKSLNLCVSKDLRKFKQVTFNAPEKSYNWLKSELVAWNLPNGEEKKGILYKPENFDPSKKYPVLIVVYEHLSSALNGALIPGRLTNGCMLNLPSYVSDGYIILCPDNYTPIGNPMVGAAENVKCAIDRITKFPYVDSTRIGMQGCSFGGAQTAFTITKIPQLAAACAASAKSDFISTVFENYGSSGVGFRAESNFLGQFRMGRRFWADKDGYIRNSALVSADKVITPFLIMQTGLDIAPKVSESRRFFGALSSLGKKVWMLEYDKADHGLYYSFSAEDFSLKMKDFFDHYLKGKPAPDWMVKPIYEDN